jgi:hypothetical protein
MHDSYSNPPHDPGHTVYKKLRAANPHLISRLTEQELSALIRLFLSSESGSQKVVVDLLLMPPEPAEPEPLDRSRGREFLQVAVLAPDWTWLLDSCTSIIQQSRLHISFCKALTLASESLQYGFVFMEVPISNEAEFETIQQLKDLLQDTLQMLAMQDEARIVLLEDNARKILYFAQVTDYIQRNYHGTDLKELLSKDGEALKYFESRSEVHLRERRVEDIAQIIIDNHTFIKAIRQNREKIFVKVGPIKTSSGTFTSISVASYYQNFSWGALLRIIEETEPHYTRKHDKIFFTSDNIAVFRLEIVDRTNQPLTPEKEQELLTKLKTTSRMIPESKLSPGVELIQRKIVPQLMTEERILKMPQAYMHPNSRNHIKVILVTSEPFQDFAIPCATSINKRFGFTAMVSESPTQIRYKCDHVWRVQEISIIDVWINFEEYFQQHDGPVFEEDLFVEIQEALKRVDYLGKHIRIFDETSRELRNGRWHQLIKKVEALDININLFKEIFYRLGNKYLMDNFVSDEEILEVIAFGAEALLKQIPRADSRPSVYYKLMTAEGRYYIWLAVPHRRNQNLLDRLINPLSFLKIRIFTQVPWEEQNLILLRFAKSSAEEVPGKKAEIRQILTKFDFQVEF